MILEKPFRETRRRLGRAFRIAWLVLVTVAPAVPGRQVPVFAQETPPQPAALPGPQEDPFGDFDDETGWPSRDQLLTMIAPVPGQRAEITETRKEKRPICRISGLFRLKPAWNADRALRLSIREPGPLKVHLWNGRQGITLQYYREFHQAWAAYGTTREGDEPRPSDLALWATDQGRYRRSGSGTFELHCRDGRLVMTRGDLTLLRVPLAGPPGEVFLEGAGLVRGLSMVPGRAVPSPPVPRAGPVRIPARLEWELGGSAGFEVGPAGYMLNKLPDGRVELVAAENTRDGQAVTPIDDSGLQELVFEVEDADVGTSVFLGDAEGRQLCRLAFVRHQETRRTAVVLVLPWDQSREKSFPQAKQPVPFAGRRQWLRVVLGAGVMKYWVSGDGVYWSQPAPVSERLEGRCSQVGLHCLPGERRRSIKLRSIEVRPFRAMASLAPEAVGERVGRLADSANLEAWEERVVQSCPADVPAELWWRAAAVETLAAGPKAPLGQPLLDRLWDRVLTGPGGWPLGRQFLEEAARLYSVKDWNDVDRFSHQWKRFGRQLAHRGDPTPLTTISRALMRSPFWHARPLPVFPEDLLRQELVARVDEDRWAEVRELCRRLRYFSRTGARDPNRAAWSAPVGHLVDWAEARAAGRTGKPGETRPAGAPIEWRHPLIEQLSKEGYNILAEFEAAVDAEAYRESCRIISASAGTEELGVLPYGSDPRLRVSLPTAVALAMREHPALRRVMEEEFGPRGAIRLKEAMAAGDAAKVEAVGLQFFGTAAAAAAHRWLGDRRLAMGRFTRAVGDYRQAMRSAPAADHAALSARIRLAGALAGRDLGRPVSEAVEIGATRLSPRDFEQLVAGLRQARQSSSSPAGAAGGDPGNEGATGFAPGRYELRRWAQLDGAGVKRPHQIPDRGLDWAGRQTAVLVAAGQMFVNNQVQLTAFDLATGRRTWAQRAALEDEKQQWALLPMRPVASGSRIFTRRLSNEGPELACIDTGDGRLLWSTKPDGYVASDPLLIGEDLLALTVGYESGETLALWLTGFDPRSGEVVRRVPLCRFLDRWRHQLPCRATLADDTILATAGGCVLCCDASGRLKWLRRQIWIRPPGHAYHEAPPWFQQIHQPPLVSDGRVYATQPGVWSVECLELGTGRLVWRRAIGDVTRLVGCTPEELIVQTTGGLLALDPRSGKPLWSYESEGQLEARLCPKQAAVLDVRLEGKRGSTDPPQLVLVWLDLQTGQPRARSAWNSPELSDLWFGPLVAYGGRQWGFLGSVEDPANREILELRPAEGEGPSEPTRLDAQSL